MIPLKTSDEIKIMHQAGQILANIIKELKDRVKPDITTGALDKLASELIFNFGVKPAFKNYRGYPNALCASINEEIVHVVPSARQIKSGDVLKLDLGIIYKGFYSDMAITMVIGNVDPEVLRLIRATKKSLKRAIKRIKPGKCLGDIGQAVENYIEGQNFKVIRELCGHGIGRALHEEPEIPNFGKRHKGLKLKEGMVLAIEPMACLGNPKIIKTKDSFGYQTIDNSISAHFEHTVAVTKSGPLVLTE